MWDTACRYLLRPPFAHEAVTALPGGTVSCPQWGPADGGEWFISDTVKNPSEPDPDGACLACSMLFTWNPDGSVKNYKTLPNPGGSSLRFMCDVGDKVP